MIEINAPLLKLAMGIEGYRFTMPPIEQFPRGIPETFIKYENMPKDAEQHALKKRCDWVARHLGDVSETFSKLAVTAADITALLQVHAAYYTDDECIARIADWIAGTHRSLPQTQFESTVGAFVDAS